MWFSGNNFSLLCQTSCSFLYLEWTVSSGIIIYWPLITCLILGFWTWRVHRRILEMFQLLGHKLISYIFWLELLYAFSPPSIINYNNLVSICCFSERSLYLLQTSLADWNNPGEVCQIWRANGCFTRGEGKWKYRWTELRSERIAIFFCFFFFQFL